MVIVVEDSAQRLAPVGEVIGKGLARGACEDGTVADIPRTRYTILYYIILYTIYTIIII